MRRTLFLGTLRGFLPWTLLLAAVTPAAAAPPSTEPVSAAVRTAALRTYVHGITEELAHAEIGPERAAELLALLADPQFPRRDNVVTFLAFLGGDETREALLAVLAAPPAPLDIPEEDRAALNVPDALGRRAARGDDAALAALLGLTQAGAPDPGAARARGAAPTMAEDLAAAALRGLALSGRPEARDRLLDVALGRIAPVRGRDLSGAAHDALELLRELGGGPALPAPEGVVPRPLPAPATGDGPTAAADAELGTEAFDTQTRTHEAALTYANHTSVPNKMTDARLDDALDNATLRMGRSDYSGDVGCCSTIVRSGTAKTFGSAGDGLDVIDTDAELRSVLNNPVSRVKVVRQINYCGGPGGNIIGCAWVGGNGMALVRLSSLGDEAILWAHEYGHNTSLSHASDFRRIMYGTINGSNNGVSQTECNTYHAPAGGSGMVVKDIGACEDPDGDEVHSVIDNCALAANANQLDSDADGPGDVCDNCATDGNPDQLNTDGDALGNVCDPDDDNDSVADGADCAPLDGTASAPAGRASNVAWQPASKTTLTWTKGAQAATSNLYRNSFGPSFPASWGCLQGGVAGSSYADATTPATGKGLSYLVTGENVCGESDAGTASSGATRSFTPCP